MNSPGRFEAGTHTQAGSAALSTTGLPTTALPTTALSTTALPTTALSTTAIPTTARLTTPISRRFPAFGIKRLASPSFPTGRLAVLVWTYVVVALVMLVGLTAAVPVGSAIAVPFKVMGIDPGALGVLVWIAVGLATSSRGSADEGRVTIIFGVAPVVASFALGGPTAAIWVAAIGSLEWRELSGRVPWYGVLANHAMIMIPAGLGGIVTLGLLDLGIGNDPQLGNLVALAAGALTFCLLNIALAVLTVYIRAGRRPSDALGISWRAVATMMTAESALAWVFAATYVSLAWWSPVVLVFADAAASSSIDRSRAHWLIRHHQLTHLPNRLALTEHAVELQKVMTDAACISTSTSMVSSRSTTPSTIRLATTSCAPSAAGLASSSRDTTSWPTSTATNLSSCRPGFVPRPRPER